MTGGFVAFGLGVSLYATELNATMGAGPAAAATTTALATIGIAASPLDSSLGGRPHAAWAGLAYASLASAPILAGRRLSHCGQTGAAAASISVGIASGASLAANAVLRHHVGLTQRVGLTLGDPWIIATGLCLARSTRLRPPPA